MTGNTLEELIKQFNDLTVANIEHISGDLAEPFIDDIKSALLEFNKAKNNEDKIAALNKIKESIKYIEINEKPSNLAKAHAFNKLNENLFVKRVF